MKINTKFNRITTMIVISTVITTVIAVSFTVVFINYRFSESIKTTTEKTTNQIARSVSENIDVYISEMIDISSDVSANIDGYIDGTLPFHLLSEFSLRNDIENIMIIRSDGELLFNAGHAELKENPNIIDQEWFYTSVPGSNLYTITTPHVQQLYKKNYPWVISLSKGLSWYDKNLVKQLGVVVVELSMDNIRRISSEEIGENGYILILNQNDEIIYHPQQQVIYAGAENKALDKIKKISSDSEILNIDGEKFYVTKSKMKNTDWDIIGVTPVIGLFTYDTEIKSFILKIILIMVIVVAGISILTSKWITKPIYKLIQLMHKVEKGEINIQSNVTGLYEVEQLSVSFNQMVFEINNLLQRIVQDQKELRKTEFKVLYNQINPHFLYNTLDSIVWLAETKNYDGVINMITNLADFFRLSLAKGKEEVTVLEEMSHVESYLSIQRIRYSNQFKYSFAIDKKLENSKTLKIILQPIVENTIKHAFGEAVEEGLINISAYSNKDNLILEVEDNGRGISPSMLEKIQNNEINSSDSGIGLRNIDQRIKIMYGQDYGIEISSVLEEGTIVKVTLPFKKEKT